MENKIFPNIQWYGSRNDVLYQSESSFKNLQSAMESVISHRRGSVPF